MKNEKPFADIGRRLAAVRTVLGMSQAKFCERAGLQPNRYNQWEEGRKRPSIDGAIALCQTYQGHISLDWIYLGEGSNLNYKTFDAIKALNAARSHTP